MSLQLDGLDEDRAFTHDITNMNFAIGVYPTKLNFFTGNIEEYLDVTVQVIGARLNKDYQDKTLGTHRCNEDDFKLFN